MALLGSSCPLFGRSGPKMNPKKFPKYAQKKKINFVQAVFFFYFFKKFQSDIKNKLKASFETQFGPTLLHKIQKRFTRETKMSPRGPSLALKSQQLPLENLKKPNGF